VTQPVAAQASCAEETVDKIQAFLDAADPAQEVMTQPAWRAWHVKTSSGSLHTAAGVCRWKRSVKTINLLRELSRRVLQQQLMTPLITAVSAVAAPSPSATTFWAFQSCWVRADLPLMRPPSLQGASPCMHDRTTKLLIHSL
jgi:hypothetical protein